MFPDPYRPDLPGRRLSALSGHQRRPDRSDHGIAENHRSLKTSTQENEMSDTKPEPFTPEQLQRISGGDCTISDIEGALAQLKDSYDTLVDFTSYVIGRVAGQ